LKHVFRRGTAVAVASAAVAVATIAAAAPYPSANAAPAATQVNQWRLASVWTHTRGQFYAVASSGRTDAWAVGIIGSQARPTGPLAAHWNGRSWQAVTIPASKGLFLDQVAETSATDVWVIGQRFGVAANSTAFIFNGKHWHATALPIGPVLQLLVLGPNDAWVANDNYCSSYSCTENIYHWNGRTWLSRPLTTYLYALTGTSDASLWAVGLAGIPSGSVTAYRWSGSQWTTRAIPYIQGAASLGAAASSSGVWISSSTTDLQRTYVLHGNAKGWKKITAPRNVPAFPVPVPDGHGGIWLGSQAHWTGSKWLAEWLPATFTEGWTGVNAAFVKAPGTTGSYWSAGYTQASNTAPPRPAIAVFGPLP
jgi:hypothetical protein